MPYGHTLPQVTGPGHIFGTRHAFAATWMRGCHGPRVSSARHRRARRHHRRPRRPGRLQGPQPVETQRRLVVRETEQTLSFAVMTTITWIFHATSGIGRFEPLATTTRCTSSLLSFGSTPACALVSAAPCLFGDNNHFYLRPPRGEACRVHGVSHPYDHLRQLGESPRQRPRA